MSVDNANPKHARTDDYTITEWAIEYLREDGGVVALGRLNDMLRFKHGACCHADRLRALMKRQARSGLVEIQNRGTAARKFTYYRWLDPDRTRAEPEPDPEPGPAPEAVAPPPEPGPPAPQRVEVEVAVKADPDGDLAAAIRMLADAIFALAGTATAPGPMIPMPSPEANHA